MHNDEICAKYLVRTTLIMETGTITGALPSPDDVKVVVDAKYAEEPIETYNIALVSKSNNGMSVLNYSNTINSGQIQTITDITPTSTPTPTPTSPPTTNPTPTPISNSNSQNITPTPKPPSQAFSDL